MSFPPGQQTPLQWNQQHQQQQQQQQQQQPQNIGLGSGNPPPPPPPRNIAAPMVGIRRNDRPNPQYNRSRKLNIHLTPLNAYGPSDADLSSSKTSGTSQSSTTDSNTFANRDPRNAKANTTVSSNPTNSFPSSDPRNQDNKNNKRNEIEKIDNVKRNRPDPRLQQISEDKISLNNKGEKDGNAQKQAQVNDPRFSAQPNSISNDPSDSKINDKRVNPLLEASRNQHNQPAKMSGPLPQRHMQEMRIPRRQSQQAQYHVHPSRQNPQIQSQARPPPPPPPKHKNQHQHNFQRRQPPNMNMNVNPHQGQFNRNQMFGNNSYGRPHQQNRPPPPPPPPKPNPIPPPPPPAYSAGHHQHQQTPSQGHPGSIQYQQQQGHRRHQRHGNNINANMHQQHQNMPNNKNAIPPPPPVSNRHPQNNFQSQVQGQGINFPNPNNQNDSNNNNQMSSSLNVPYSIPPPPPPLGSGHNPGPSHGPQNPNILNNNQQHIQPNQIPGQGQGQYVPNVPNPHMAGGTFHPTAQHQQQPIPFGASGRASTAPPPHFNHTASQNQPPPNQYQSTIAPPQHQKQQQYQPALQHHQQQKPPPSYSHSLPPPIATNTVQAPQVTATHLQQSHPPQMHQSQPPQIMGAVPSSSIPSSIIPSTHLLSRPQQQQQIQPQQHRPTKKAESPWTEHTAPSGIKYYYNSVTKVSTYSKPDDFEGPRNASTSNQSLQKQAENNAKESGPAKSKWKEYIDASTGKTYYSDGKTTSWEKPDHFEKSPSKRKYNNVSTSLENNTSKPKKSKKKSSGSDNTQYHPKKEPTYANKEEAIAAFKGLLLAKGISPAMKWADVFKICSEDYRWSACKTLGERKQALAEYQTKRANEEKEMRRQEIKRAKDAFHQLMTDMLPRLGINPNSRFGECRDKLAKDDRFFAVEDEESREELFYDFVEEMRKREERLNRAKKKAARDAFWSFMKEKEESGLLTYASTWTSFKSSLDGQSASDPRFVVSSCFIDADRQLMFADYVIDLQAAEDEKRRRIRKARLDAEKAQRDAYRAFLRSLAKEGKITIVTRWRNIEETASNDPTFIPVKEQDDDAPRMIFEDFVDDMKDRYRKDKHFLSRLVSPTRTFSTGIVVGKSTEYDEFCENLLKAAGKEHESECKKVLNREPVSSVRWFFNELHLRAKNAAAAAYATSSSPYSGRRSSSLLISTKDESEDEGEIKEDGEVTEDTAKP